MALDRRKVTMRSVVLASDGRVLNLERLDYIAVEHIDAFVTQAWTQWQYVSVGTETDHGPGGVDGPYVDPTIPIGA